MYKIHIATPNNERYILEIPLPEGFLKKEKSYDLWFNRLMECYFFGNQEYIFECFLTRLNGKVYISFNTKKQLSREFMEFVLATYPERFNDKKRRIFESLR